MANPLLELKKYGQSVWYDNLNREMMLSGKLQKMVDEDGITGGTSNPSIFEKAIASSADYDDDIRRLAAEGHGAEEIFEALAIADVRAACDAFRAVYERTGGADGLVSLEVSPTLARDGAATEAAARRLWAAVARPNLMINIPGTEEGLGAIERCIADGINVNVLTSNRFWKNVERVLDRKLLVRMSSIVGRQGVLEAFIVQEVDWI